MSDTRPVPTNIAYHSKSKILEVSFGDDVSYTMSAEYLRVYSPSAEVRGHGPGQETLQVGKENVRIENIEHIDPKTQSLVPRPADARQARSFAVRRCAIPAP
ncbi:MAG: gamma-butyrobetaine hydroxylase-like domain-containing protein, partial [Gammaproteobacteria bacterium]